MSWINENKTAAVTIGVGAVLTIALVGVGLKFSGQANDAALTYKDNLTTINSLESAPTSPEPETVQELGQLVGTYSDRVAQLKERLTKYGVEKITPVSGQAFNDELKGEVEDFKALAKSRNIIVPDEFYMGFEEYRQQLPKSEAAGHLSYELKATSWFFDRMLDSGLERVISIVRKPIKVEEAAASQSRTPPRNGRGKSQDSSPDVMIRMPIEIVVEAKKGAWAKILTSIASADAEHFFVIRGLRVVNEKTKGPDQNAVTFGVPDEEADDDGGDSDFVIPDAEDAGAELEEKAMAMEDKAMAKDDVAMQEMPDKAEGEEVVKSVLGTESIFIALQLEIIHFLPNVDVPEGPRKDARSPAAN